MKWISASMLITAAWLPVTVLADGRSLLVACQISLSHPRELTGVDASKAGHCLGTIGGVVDTLSIMQANGLVSANAFCLPEKAIPASERVREVVEFLNAHPEDLDSMEAKLIITALMKAYPCTSERSLTQLNN